MTSIGENIKSDRKKLGITQDELAEKLSVTRQAVSNWENGKTEPDIETLTKIAQIFDISIDELVDGKPMNRFGNLSKKEIIVSLIFIIFSAISFIAFEIISPALEDYVYKYYDYRFYYLIVGFWKPIAIMLGTGGMVYVALKIFKIDIKNILIKKSALIIGIFITSAVFISNIATIAIMFYIYSCENVSVSSYLMSPAFFMMQHQILYTVPAILLILGLYKNNA